MPKVVVTATIPLGQSVSNSIDLSAGDAQFCHMPAAWTPALLTFLVSYDNVTFGDLVDQSGREISLNVLPGTVIKVDLVPSHVGWMKFRSGSRTRAVVQTAARSFIIIAES